MPSRATAILVACTLTLACASCRPAGSPLVAAAAEGGRAAHTGQIETIAPLVRRGADPDRPSGRNGWTPLLHVIHKDRPESVRALIAAGADVNLGVGWGFTPLMMAAGNGNLPIVETLLENGADPRAPDLRLGRVRPVDVSRLFAHLNGCDEVLRLTASQ